jgi:hypothetical protein
MGLMMFFGIIAITSYVSSVTWNMCVVCLYFRLSHKLALTVAMRTRGNHSWRYLAQAVVFPRPWTCALLALDLHPDSPFSMVALSRFALNYLLESLWANDNTDVG